MRMIRTPRPPAYYIWRRTIRTPLGYLDFPRVNRTVPYPFYFHALLPLNMSHFCLLLSLYHLPLFVVGSVFLLLFFLFPGCRVYPSPWTCIPAHR